MVRPLYRRHRFLRLLVASAFGLLASVPVSRAAWSAALPCSLASSRRRAFSALLPAARPLLSHPLLIGQLRFLPDPSLMGALHRPLHYPPRLLHHTRLPKRA